MYLVPLFLTLITLSLTTTKSLTWKDNSFQQLPRAVNRYHRHPLLKNALQNDLNRVKRKPTTQSYARWESEEEDSLEIRDIPRPIISESDDLALPPLHLERRTDPNHLKLLAFLSYLENWKPQNHYHLSKTRFGRHKR
ncbi:unnamed protein product [Didymodactylos carnosus]|uniref:Uncharacterized protein n=1 Tax=Didymodactylos carnosus TaxID=1234261 RepID=A0A814W3N4_9BILA|nr:unnamed protein product [Didymodactylos carnosus]CAF3960421.1 unnamed protein product [Didymodactylos carnosus]